MEVFQLHKNRLAISAYWLMSMQILTEANYKQLKYRKQLEVIQRGCYNTPALLSYESIPEL